MRSKLEDMDLIAQAIEGNQSAYTELLNRYKKSVYFLIFRIVKNNEDAEDLTYITFAKAFKNIEKYIPTHGFSTWLFRIASNASIDYLRKNTIDTVGISSSYENEVGEVFLDNKIVASAPNPEERFIREQRLKFVQQIVQHLDSDFEKVIRLRFFEEYSYEEIANELNIPIGTVKVQIFRAKKLLQSILKDNIERI
ncbi:MAG: sigma-70 family RNA polymerase sigma factor [Chitinophagales bacterium]|nr:sigma-70 family RNA polymerase sigma factor [Chitinophagales bacterium]MCZ2393802.1 sigma-70 family RNA polymerase sigma factor [Chitinophagales bacterium]